MAAREQWGSKMGFIMAAAGSAVGLGNIWKFPYITGENGGGAFVLVYLACIALIGVPIMLAELVIGRRGQKDPVGSFLAIKPNSPWAIVGFMGVLIQSISGEVTNFVNPEAAGEHFEGFIANPLLTIIYQAIFIILCVFIVYKGVKDGIEKWSKILMPALLTILIFLVIWGLTLPNAMKGVEFYLKPDFSKLSGEAILIALGHAFFSLSLGMGAMITYGSYLSKKDNLVFDALIVSAMDTGIALLAGLAMFPAVFAYGLDPAAGPGLVFQVLPAVFSKMPGGIIFSTLFFLLLAIAALTSGISLLEVVTAYFVDELKWKRHKAVITFGGVIFLLGIPSALSFGLLGDIKLFDKTFFDNVDFLASNILLPLGGLLIALFIGWGWGAKGAIKEIREGCPSIDGTLGIIWGVVITFIAPIAVAIVFIKALGII